DVIAGPDAQSPQVLRATLRTGEQLRVCQTLARQHERLHVGTPLRRLADQLPVARRRGRDGHYDSLTPPTGTRGPAGTSTAPSTSACTNSSSCSWVCSGPPKAGFRPLAL